MMVVQKELRNNVYGDLKFKCNWPCYHLHARQSPRQTRCSPWQFAIEGNLQGLVTVALYSGPEDSTIEEPRSNLIADPEEVAWVTSESRPQRAARKRDGVKSLYLYKPPKADRVPVSEFVVGLWSSLSKVNFKSWLRPRIQIDAAASAEALLSDTRRAAGALAEVASGPRFMSAGNFWLGRMATRSTKFWLFNFARILISFSTGNQAEEINSMPLPNIVASYKVADILRRWESRAHVETADSSYFLTCKKRQKLRPILARSTRRPARIGLGNPNCVGVHYMQQRNIIDSENQEIGQRCKSETWSSQDSDPRCCHGMRQDYNAKG
ncbi:hypothetical protein B0H10DRAFT_1967011 [Mycena sp. CBHHK59/15]|nr:hypothetical protein B0H10DRAFT_1967011 [Mycena sp. CBHHK59/15]